VVDTLESNNNNSTTNNNTPSNTLPNNSPLISNNINNNISSNTLPNNSSSISNNNTISKTITPRTEDVINQIRKQIRANQFLPSSSNPVKFESIGSKLVITLSGSNSTPTSPHVSPRADHLPQPTINIQIPTENEKLENKEKDQPIKLVKERSKDRKESKLRSSNSSKQEKSLQDSLGLGNDKVSSRDRKSINLLIEGMFLFFYNEFFHLFIKFVIELSVIYSTILALT
jgi:hypothetical protein